MKTYYCEDDVRTVNDMWESTATLDNTIYVLNENAYILKEVLERLERIEKHLGIEKGD